MKIESIAVYCGSSRGTDPVFAEAAAHLGGLLAAHDIDVVFGGGRVGLMGVLADAVLEAGGRVHGVITAALVDSEIAHEELTSLAVVDTMHERKAAMADRADAFIAMPGGFGTLDEFLEMVTWGQLGIHRKPCGILDIAGFFGPLRTFVDTATNFGFIHEEHRDSLVIAEHPGEIIGALASWEPTYIPKWVDPNTR